MFYLAAGPVLGGVDEIGSELTMQYDLLSGVGLAVDVLLKKNVASLQSRLSIHEARSR